MLCRWTEEEELRVKNLITHYLRGETKKGIEFDIHNALFLILITGQSRCKKRRILGK